MHTRRTRALSKPQATQRALALSALQVFRAKRGSHQWHAAWQPNSRYRSHSTATVQQQWLPPRPTRVFAHKTPRLGRDAPAEPANEPATAAAAVAACGLGATRVEVAATAGRFNEILHRLTQSDSTHAQEVKRRTRAASAHGARQGSAGIERNAAQHFPAHTCCRLCNLSAAQHASGPLCSW